MRDTRSKFPLTLCHDNALTYANYNPIAIADPMLQVAKIGKLDVSGRSFLQIQSHTSDYS